MIHNWGGIGVEKCTECTCNNWSNNSYGKYFNHDDDSWYGLEQGDRHQRTYVKEHTIVKNSSCCIGHKKIPPTTTLTLTLKLTLTETQTLTLTLSLTLTLTLILIMILTLTLDLILTLTLTHTDTDTDSHTDTYSINSRTWHRL